MQFAYKAKDTRQQLEALLIEKRSDEILPLVDDMLAAFSLAAEEAGKDAEPYSTNKNRLCCELGTRIANLNIRAAAQNMSPKQFDDETSKIMLAYSKKTAVMWKAQAEQRQQEAKKAQKEADGAVDVVRALEVMEKASKEAEMAIAAAGEVGTRKRKQNALMAAEEVKEKKRKAEEVSERIRLEQAEEAEAARVRAAAVAAAVAARAAERAAEREAEERSDGRNAMVSDEESGGESDEESDEESEEEIKKTVARFIIAEKKKAESAKKKAEKAAVAAKKKAEKAAVAAKKKAEKEAEKEAEKKTKAAKKKADQEAKAKDVADSPSQLRRANKEMVAMNMEAWKKDCQVAQLSAQKLRARLEDKEAEINELKTKVNVLLGVRKKLVLLCQRLGYLDCALQIYNEGVEEYKKIKANSRK